MAEEQKAIWGDVKQLKSPAYEPAAGSFAICQESGGRLVLSKFYHCRDVFHTDSRDLAAGAIIAFVCTAAAAPKVAAFVTEFEKRLGHEKLTRMGLTNSASIMWVEPAAFWFGNPLRRSLFTALLRAGVGYNPETNNFDAAIAKEKYLGPTKAAVKHFLEGHTWISSEVDTARGWYDNFAGISVESLTKRLTFKPIKEKDLWRFVYDKLGVEDGTALRKMYRTEVYGKKKDADANPAPVEAPAPEAKK